MTEERYKELLDLVYQIDLEVWDHGRNLDSGSFILGYLAGKDLDIHECGYFIIRLITEENIVNDKFTKHYIQGESE